MRQLLLFGTIALAGSLVAPVGVAAPETPGKPAVVRHALEVRLEPSAHRLEVRDRVTLPDAWLDAGEIRFVLHGGLDVAVESADWRVEPFDGEVSLTRYGINEESPGEAAVPLREYVLRPASGETPVPRFVPLRYAGEIHHPVQAEEEEYARSFSRTPGLISTEGVFLSGSSVWLPTFGDELVAFDLDVDLPQGWTAVSQGSRTSPDSREGRRRVRWREDHPMDEAYLVAAPFVEYSRPAGDATAYAFLRADEPNLAAKYLEATVQYLEMYRKLIGPYPYGKFALVENFWETGYGMPSFTLLGPQVIRLPFILHSSYPHEILHNWWGNSVFVDYDSGNWCEGLTAYLADHLIREGQGQGASYRRDTLNKYRAHVRSSRDFPLSEFRSRHSASTEAVGYGKSLMLWHMLRRRLGDEAFADALRRFYREHRFRRAGFDDLARAFGDAAGEDMQPLFDQWVRRSGAPELELGDVRHRSTAGGRVELHVELRQTQAGEPYRLAVPLAVSIAGQADPLTFEIEMTGRTAKRTVDLPGVPTRVDADPEFDLFRRLDPMEIPPSFAQLFGAEQVTLVLPGEPDGASREDWLAFAESWAGDRDDVAVIDEDALGELPDDRAVWFLGAANGRAQALAADLRDAGGVVGDDGIAFGESRVPRADHCFALALRHPANPDLALGWIGADNPRALPGLARKLPHYGKYSYVAFAGDEPANDAKGQWPVRRSPMTVLLGTPPAAAPALPTREPLARLEPVFDPGRMSRRAAYLASEEMRGRGVGTPEHRAAAEFIVRAFADAGLQPAGDDGGWFQTWTEPAGPGGAPVELRNIVGVLPGTKSDWASQSVVVAAHYDHLGTGWPDVRSGFEGRVHPGADDNASGVAVLLELADLLGSDFVPQRSVVFVAFDAEEWDLRGSRHYAEVGGALPAKEAIGMINLDTVGRLADGELTVLGTGTATEWVHIARGIGFTTGIRSRAVADDPGGSDQKSFHAIGVPAIQIFAGPNADYHRPSDTADKLDVDGMVKVAAFVREAVVYLSERDRPLTSTLSETAPQKAAPAAAGSSRRVSLGTMPDFGFPGPGVKVTAVIDGSPAAVAGLMEGDLLLAIDGEPIENLRGYSALLRARSPGDTITIRLRRDEEEIEVRATLVAR